MNFGCLRIDALRHAECSQLRSNPLGADRGIVERPDRDALRMVSCSSSRTEERQLRVHLVPGTRDGYRRPDSRSRHFARSYDPYHLGKSMSMVDPETLPDWFIKVFGVDGDDLLRIRHARVHDAAHAIAESRAVPAMCRIFLCDHDRLQPSPTCPKQCSNCCSRRSNVR